MAKVMSIFSIGVCVWRFLIAEAYSYLLFIHQGWRPWVTSEVDPVIHPVNRLRICATLKAAGAVESSETAREMKFAVLRELATLSDATLSKQLGVLESRGYIIRHREYGSSRAKDTVWVALTATGDAALQRHLTALKEITDIAQND